MLAPSPALDGQFSAFGRIVEGLDILDAFAKDSGDGVNCYATLLPKRGGTPEDLGAFIRGEVAKLEPIIREAKIPQVE